MDIAAIIAKLVGIVLLFFTARSVYKHIKSKLAKRKDSNRPKANNKHEQTQPRVEQALNTLLLYAWFVFMTAFSLGLVVNN